MKIYVKNNRIVCSLENKNINFWYGAEYKYFVGGVRYDTRYALVRPMDYQYKTLGEASDDLKTLNAMLRDAERHNIGTYYLFKFVPYPSEECPMNPKEASCGRA